MKINTHEKKEEKNPNFSTLSTIVTNSG